MRERLRVRVVVEHRDEEAAFVARVHEAARRRERVERVDARAEQRLELVALVVARRASAGVGRGGA